MTYDLGGTTGTAAIRRGRSSAPAGGRREPAIGRRRDDDRSRAPAPPSSRAGTADQGFGRPPGATAGRSPRRPGALFTICAAYLFVSGVLLHAALRHAVRGRRLPLAAVLAPVPSGLAAVVAQPRPAHPVDPDRLPGHLLLLPQGLLPVLLRRPAGLRGRRADDPPALPRWRPRSRSSSRTCTATCCTSRSSRCSSCGSTRSTSLWSDGAAGPGSGSAASCSS